MFEPSIEFHDILTYVGGGERPFKEGAAILKAKHLVQCGITSRDEDSFHILGLCLQTSHLDGKPHEIKIVVNTCDSPRISGTCSCKAGSGKCKHFVAVLLFLNRTPLENLEDLSCTDITQKWGKYKSMAKAMYEPRPTKRFCHAQAREPSAKQSPGFYSSLLEKLLEGEQNSALDQHRSGRILETLAQQSPPPSPSKSIRKAGFINSLVMSSNDFTQKAMRDLPDHLVNCSPDQQVFYQQQVVVNVQEAAAICLSTSNQVGDTWLNHRKVRITGSRSYELYTYNRPGPAARNWEKKLETIVFSTFKGNEDTTYGLANEKNAILAYSRQTSNAVEHFGLVINVNTPWLGCSPDGIVVDQGRLIEAKCLKLGKIYHGLELAIHSGCCTVNSNLVTLNKKHKYFGQVQLGMLTTGLRVCDFLLYSRSADEVFIIEVPFDPTFCEKFIYNLQSVYFKFLLPFLVKNNERLTLHV